MASNRDPFEYYAVLGVDPSASIDKIKKAFKAKAQQLHPDRNPSAEATRQFQYLNQAYQVLSNSHSRSEYDANTYLFVEHSDVEKRTSAPVAPIICCVCGKISAQPRYAIYRHVVSFVVATHRGGHQGVFCAKCGAKRAYKNSLTTWILGWWGIPWGPIYSVQAILHNMLGGEQPPLSNFRLLGMQAAHFASNGRMDFARLLADQALTFATKISEFENGQASGADRDLKGLLMAIQSAKQPQTRGLKQSWGTGSASFRFQASASGFIVVALLALIISGAHTSRKKARPGIRCMHIALRDRNGAPVQVRAGALQ